MSKPHVIHMISNTHWDREWLTNFQETRVMLADFFDRLLEILDTAPEYRSYVLDSQTIPVEDYLAIRPEEEGRIRKHVAAGRLLIGPWYTDPEGFCVNGESMVRNLTYGHRVAAHYGGVMKVGHTSFGYGQNSQMPQIYEGFGIDTILFYHGVSHDEVPNEWVFEGADGTRILGSQMSHYARYNAYHHLLRPALYGKGLDERSYAWTEGGLPFHLCRGDAAHRQHILLDPVRGWHEELLRERLQWLKDKEVSVSTTRHLAFMMGHDSSVPDAAELDILEEAKRAFPGDEVLHDTYPEMMARIKAEADWDRLPVLRGERRTPKLMPVTMHLYSDVLSSRTRMKLMNTKAEYLLQRRAEPFAAWAALLGERYPAGLLDHAWKTLLSCHAHDSIAGSGIDDIELDMRHRLRQVIHISEAVLRNALGAIQRRIDTSALSAADVVVTVFNASLQPRTEVVSARIDLPDAAARGEFGLVDLATGEPVPVQMRSRRPHTAIVNHAGDAPMNLPTEQLEVHFPASEIPAMGYRSYRIARDGRFRRGTQVTAPREMDNEHLKVRIEENGTLTLTHKQTGAAYRDVHYFLDNGEAGHAWMHHDPAHDRVIDSRGFAVSIALEEDGALLTRYRVTWHMRIPSRLEENGGDSWQRLDGVGNAAARSTEEVDFPVTSWITLRRGAKRVDIRTRFDNRATHHRLRVVFPTRRAGATCHAESAFDVVERETEFGPGSPWHGTKNVTFPMQRFVDVTDGEAGLAVLNHGLREYEVTQDGDRAIVVTLMRAFTVALCPVSKCWEELPEMELAQCPGPHEFEYAIYPHAGDYASGGLLGEADRFVTPLEVAQAGPHPGELPLAHGFLASTPENLLLSAVKRSEDGKGYVLRLFNPTDETLTGALSFVATPVSACLTNLEEKEEEPLTLSGSVVSLKAGPRKIVCVKVVFERL